MWGFCPKKTKIIKLDGSFLDAFCHICPAVTVVDCIKKSRRPVELTIFSSAAALSHKDTNVLHNNLHNKCELWTSTSVLLKQRCRFHLLRFVWKGLKHFDVFFFWQTAPNLRLWVSVNLKLSFWSGIKPTSGPGCRCPAASGSLGWGSCLRPDSGAGPFPP